MSNPLTEPEELDAGCYCSQCLAWMPPETGSPDAEGECRRRVPSREGFPRTKRDSWCAEGIHYGKPSPHKVRPEQCGACVFYNTKDQRCYVDPRKPDGLTVDKFRQACHMALLWSMP